MNALKISPVRGALRCWLSIVVVTAAIISVTQSAIAQMPNPVNQFGRWQGIGWGDGYHACKSSGCRVWADLPPANDYRRPGKAHPVSHIISHGTGRTFYDRFDALNRSGQCESGSCDAADCDQCDAVSFANEPNWNGPSQGVALNEDANQANDPHEYPSNPVELPTFSGPPQPEFVIDQALNQPAAPTPPQAKSMSPPPKAKVTPSTESTPRAKPTRPAPPTKAPQETQREAAIDEKPALVAPLANTERPGVKKPRRLGRSTTSVHEVAASIDANRHPNRLGNSIKPTRPQVESVAIDSIDPPQRAKPGIEIIDPTDTIHTNPFATSQPTTGVARRPSAPTDSAVR